MQERLNDASPQTAQSGRLLRILGVGFGLAVVIGGTVGVGILRSTADDHFRGARANFRRQYIR